MRVSRRFWVSQGCVPSLLRLFAVAALLAGPVLASGCWDRSELDQVAIVAAMGVDAVAGGSVKVTAQIAVPGKSSSAEPTSGKGGAPGTMPMTTFAGTGLTVADAITRGMYEFSPHKVFLSHLDVVVIGQEEAKRGIDPVMDHLLRHQEFRENLWVLVSASDAETVVKTPMGHQMVAARAIMSLVQNEIRVGNARASQMHTLAEEMLDPTRAATTALISVDSPDSEPKIKVTGSAVIKGGKLVGELDEELTRGLMWALGEVGGGSVTAKCRCGHDCSVFINRASGKITGRLVDGRPEITIEVKMDGTADVMQCSEDLTEPGALEFLNEQQSLLIEGEIRRALDRAKEMNADIFGFGAAVHANYRGDWKPIEKDWDSLFQQAEVNIKVDTRLQYISLLTRPFVSGEAK